MKAKTKAKAAAPAKISKTKAARPAAKAEMGRAAALNEAGDLTGPFALTAAARAAGAPAALRLKEGSARWNIMKYAFAHPKAKLDRSDLERIAGAQLGQALSGLVRYRFLARA